MGSRRFLAAVASITLLIVALTLWEYPSSTDFATSNPYWNGLRQVGRQFGVTNVRTLNLLPRQARGTALVVIPYVSPSSSDLDALTRYVQDGGVLILMDDFGFGNAVLARLGVSARLGGQVLVDPLFNFKNSRFPRIVEFSAGPVSEGVGQLVLNHATAIRDAGGMTVVARSSLASFLDVNENGQRDADEAGGPFAVAAVERVGAGYLVLVSDSSILLNSMLDLAQNRRFVENLFRLAGDGAQVYLDQAHLPRAPLDMAKEGLARFREALAIPLIAFAVIGVGLVLPLAMLLRPSRR